MRLTASRGGTQDTARTRRERSERLYPYLLVAPVIAIVGLGVVLGLGYLLILSSQRYSLIRLNDI
jgi:uncharacterized RDD family membrane protein YckC